MKTRVLSRTRILASLATKQWGWSRKSLVRVFKATIQSVLHYCGAGWQPWLAKSNLQILERAQNRALRVITGQLSDTPLECLRIEAEIMSVAVAVRRNCLIAWEKSARLPQSNPRRSLFDNPVPHRWKNRSSFSQMAIAECDSACLNTLPRQILTPPKPPPWTWDADPTWKVITVLKGGSGKSSNKDTLLHDTIDTLSSSATPDIIIYTDGSAKSGIANGGSAAIITTGPASNPTRISSISETGRRWTSSYETEVSALNLAVKWLQDNDNRRYKFVIICADSQSTLSALRNSGRSNGVELSEVR